VSGRDTPIEQMPVVVLAGGMGTRLREETERVPKPLVEIGERPILWHIMKLYGHHGAHRFLVCLGYKSWAIKEYFLRYHEQSADLTVHIGGEEPPTFHGPVDEDWEVTLAETGLTTGTGGRLQRVRAYLDTDTFMFTYGDGLGRVDIGALLDFHRSHDRIGTVTGVRPSSRYGEMAVSDGVVTEFNEKPTAPEGFVSGGFFVFQREIFEYLTEEPGLILEHGLPPRGLLDGDGHLPRVRGAQRAVGVGRGPVEGVGALKRSSCSARSASDSRPGGRSTSASAIASSRRTSRSSRQPSARPMGSSPSACATGAFSIAP
jgi:glucose-1-phosphate cytidylyltransferase